MFHTHVASILSGYCICFTHVASVLSGCCIYFTHMLQVYISNVSSALDVCCIQVFHVASILCFRGIFIESWRHGPGARGRDVVSRGSTDEACSALRVLQMGRARPHPGS